jgi:hypothetical protein
MSEPEAFRVVRASEIPERDPDEPAWLIENLWSAGAVGVIGGCPKIGKSWLALEMAVSVASGRPCLGHYAVPKPGTALVFGAEDAPVSLRERVEHLARARGTDFAALEVQVILEPSLRLNRLVDRRRLQATLAHYRPKLLVLDPYVRLQSGVDENDATQVSAILGVLRELSRAFEVAIALVHHTRKGGAEDPGLSLRGSGDFWAWGDSNLYLRRQRDRIALAIEHRSAAAPPPVTLLLTDEDEDEPLHLEVQCGADVASQPALEQRILEHLSGNGPCLQQHLRRLLRVRNQHLGRTLREMADAGHIRRSSKGWTTAGRK